MCVRFGIPGMPWLGSKEAGKGNRLCIMLWIFLARAGQGSRRWGEKRNFSALIHAIKPSESLVFASLVKDSDLIADHIQQFLLHQPKVWGQ